MNAAGVKKIAIQAQRDFESRVHRAQQPASTGQVLDIQSIRATIESIQQAAKVVQGPSSDNLQAAIRVLARTAPEALGAIAQAVHGAMAQAEERVPLRTSRYSAQFHRALSGLSKHGIAIELAGHALQLWHRFCADANPPEPIIEGTLDGGVRFAWSTTRVYLDVEVYLDGTVEWFFEDRETGKTDGTEDERDAQLPDQFFNYMRALEKL